MEGVLAPTPAAALGVLTPPSPTFGGAPEVADWLDPALIED
jgi:hypothetical protein